MVPDRCHPLLSSPFMMKRGLLVISSVSFWLVAVSSLNAQELRIRGPHPRLFFTPERIANLQARIQTEPTTATAWSNLLANPKSIEELSLAYRMTGEKRFAERARDAVLRLRWSDSMLLKRDPPWHAGLGTARSCYESAWRSIPFTTRSRRRSAKRWQTTLWIAASCPP